MNPPKQFMQNAYQKKIYILFLVIKKKPQKTQKVENSYVPTTQFH